MCRIASTDRPGSSRYSTRLVAGLVSLALIVTVAGNDAVAETLSGTWVGSGFVSPAAGQRERVRCRVIYTPRSSRIVGVSATCASASTTLRQVGELVKVRENRYVGDFFNPQFNISGRVRVVLSGGSQTVTLSSSEGQGQLSLRRR